MTIMPVATIKVALFLAANLGFVLGETEQAVYIHAKGVPSQIDFVRGLKAKSPKRNLMTPVQTPITSPLCKPWCLTDARPWDTKCGFDNCRQCGACCKDWCSADTHSFATKCGFESCSGCNGCAELNTKAPTTQPGATTQPSSMRICKPWCLADSNPWEVKCGYKNCRQCGACCQSWCAENTFPFETKCRWENCGGCDGCAEFNTQIPSATPSVNGVPSAVPSSVQPKLLCKPWCLTDARPWDTKCGFDIAGSVVHAARTGAAQILIRLRQNVDLKAAVVATDAQNLIQKRPPRNPAQLHNLVLCGYVNLGASLIQILGK
eukprot:CAMPEP_0195538934 /NCGR_PEP_ID=MMETSP0794_2-20130614/49792_1 /TAXON_ID=515487 /ORGANISM="Stephanopyxis turris, Strain CCMP 815" /LENGTH=319 /DNA_ID=CAMNT_0040672945 /DNA_START=102 /DNA_END=1062 /DNA_ORIENTATION=-